AGVSLLVIIGTAVIYWFVGVNPSSAEFLIATDGEMKKVNWSTRRDIINSTGVVILWSVLLAAGLWVVDFLLSQFFTLIGVLQSSRPRFRRATSMAEQDTTKTPGAGATGERAGLIAVAEPMRQEGMDWFVLGVACNKESSVRETLL